MDQFDARRLKTAKHGETLTFEGYPGLRFEIGLARRTWIYRYVSPVNAKTKQIKLGVYPEVSAAAAIVAWEGKKRDRDRGIDPAEEKRAARAAEKAQELKAHATTEDGGATVREVVMNYYTRHTLKARAPDGAAAWLLALDRHLGVIYERPVSGLTRKEAFDTLEACRDSAPSTAIKLRGFLSSAWGFGIDSGMLPDTTPDWWPNILKGQIEVKGRMRAGERQTELRTLSETELRKLIPWLENFGHNYRDVLKLYIWTGLRGGEICPMHDRELAYEDGVLWWTIPKARTKNRNVRHATAQRTPLIGHAREVVEARMGKVPSGFLFAPERNPLGVARPGRPVSAGKAYVTQKQVSNAVRERQPYDNSRSEWVRARLPVTHWSPHDLRRSSRTLLSAMDCPDRVAEAVIGHVTGDVYDRHTYDMQKLTWLTKLDARLAELSQPIQY